MSQFFYTQGSPPPPLTSSLESLSHPFNQAFHEPDGLAFTSSGLPSSKISSLPLWQTISTAQSHTDLFLETAWSDKDRKQYGEPHSFAYDPLHELSYPLSPSVGSRVDFASGSASPLSPYCRSLLWDEPLSNIGIRDAETSLFTVDLSLPIKQTARAHSCHLDDHLTGSLLPPLGSPPSSGYMSSAGLPAPARYVNLSELSISPSLSSAEPQLPIAMPARGTKRSRSVGSESEAEAGIDTDLPADDSSEYVPSPPSAARSVPESLRGSGRGRPRGRGRGDRGLGQTRGRPKSSHASLKSEFTHHDLSPLGPLPIPVPVPNLTKKSRGRKVPIAPDDSSSGPSPSARSYVCNVPYCGKRFVRGEHLKRHVRSIHTYDKPHVCPCEGCDKSFSRRDNLRQHLRVHTD